MCGIAGYIGRGELPPERVAECLRLLNHRGPDQAASRSWRTKAGRDVVLIHTRLSIIDLNMRACQPFAMGPQTMVYNGELYNYRELRSNWALNTWRSESDTEVLLRAFQEWGPSALDKFEGMWALAIYDERDESLFLSRDRFGEKPLYLLRRESGLYFASETRALAALAGETLDVDFDQVKRYLVNGYKALYKQKGSFYRGVEELAPASVLRVSAEGHESTSEYWHPPMSSPTDMSYDEAVKGTRERLIRAVEIRLRADVPLAFCMSGGVDSNSLIAIAKRVFDFDVHGFTILNDDARYAEWDEISGSVRGLGIRHTPVPISTDAFPERITELVRAHDSPISTISYYIHWLLMKEIAAAGYRVSVSGTGADELFTGYYDHHNLFLYELRNTPLFAEALAAWESHIAPIVRNPYLQNPRLYLEDAGRRDHIFLNSREFSGYLLDDWWEPFTERDYPTSLLRKRMLNELFVEGVPVILHEDDLNAMYYSIENRSPFLDRTLTEFAYSIPTRHLIKDGKAKIVLRDAMKGIVPDCVLDNRRKVGFNAPVESFLDITNPAIRDWLLEPGPLFDILRRERLADLLGRHGLKNSESKFLFYIVNAKVFLEQHT